MFLDFYSSGSNFQAASISQHEAAHQVTLINLRGLCTVSQQHLQRISLPVQKLAFFMANLFAIVDKSACANMLF